MKYTIIPLCLFIILGFCLSTHYQKVNGKNGTINISENNSNLPIKSYQSYPEKGLYAITENQRWGYIDFEGNLVIPPKFHSVGMFSEGLAPARLNGTYGFIDHTGEFVIPAQYDMAYSFYKGNAKVYIDGIPYFIDKMGKILFEHDFAEMSVFTEEGISVVNNANEKFGVIDQHGDVIVDTIYKQITEFSNELAVVTGANHEPYPDEDQVPIYEKGVIDTKGNFVVPIGKYKDISNFINGFAEVSFFETDKEGQNLTGIIDSSGKLKFKIPDNEWYLDLDYPSFSDGLAVINIYLKNPNDSDSWYASERFKGVVDIEGKIVFANRKWKEITPFHRGKALAKNKRDNWSLINKKGEVLNKETFFDIAFDNSKSPPKNWFQNGKIFVKTTSGWGGIDEMGNFVVQPLKFEFPYNDVMRRGEVIIFNKDISQQNSNYYHEYGFWNTAKDILVEPKFHSFSPSNFSKPLTYVMKDGQMGYINEKGEFIWREKEQSESKSHTLNIDYMNRAYCYAASPKKEELRKTGGWGGSGNHFQKISNRRKFAKKQLSMLAKIDEKARFRDTYEGMKLYVANTSKETYYFEAQDSRLYLNMQAKDKNGNWRDIEYLPSSWCGNSYHTLFLPPKRYWEFTVPIYEGEFPTKIRAKLLYKENYEQGENLILYSNEFEGSVNPGQFWQKMGYSPRGIMDPYND